MVAGFVRVCKPCEYSCWLAGGSHSGTGLRCALLATGGGTVVGGAVGQSTMFGGKASSEGSRRLEGSGCSCPWLKVAAAKKKVPLAERRVHPGGSRETKLL